MLKVAVKHYLTSIGDKIFIPNPDYPEFVTADCLDVVIKRKPKWFWQKPIYTYDNFGLNDLLNLSLPSDKSMFFKQPLSLTPNYTFNDKFSIKGKIGAEIASLMSFDISGDDIVTLSVDFEDMMIQSIDYSAVQNMLKTNKINLNSKYLNRVAQDKYNVVCIVSKYIYINKATEIKVTVNRDIEETGDINKNKTCDLDDKANYKSDKSKSIIFNAGSKIAFEFSECLITADGKIELLDRSDHSKNIQGIPESKERVQLPNYCAHITMDNQNYDIPDSTNFDNFQSLSYLRNQLNLFDIKTNLLDLVLENKNLFTKLELFLLHCQQETVNKEIELESLSIFNEENYKNYQFKMILEKIGLDTNKKKIVVRALILNKDLLKGILCLMQSIFHLEIPHLENLQKIFSTYDPLKIKELFSLLEGCKLLNFNKAEYERLAKDSLIKSFLRMVGINEVEKEPNEYFEPILILLYV